jgi:hypothetical protein
MPSVRLFICMVLIALPFTLVNAQVSFITNGQNIRSSKSWDVSLVDLNGDSTPDAVFGGEVWLNDGAGRFAKSGISAGAGLYPGFADLNGDGFVDILNNDSIFLNDGSFHFRFSKKLTSDISMYKSVLADINNDCFTDIISCSMTSDRILLNDGKGGFINTGKSLGGWAQATYAVGDINGDGFTDIYAAIPHTPPNGGHTPNLIWLGDGKGNFTQRTHDIPGAESRGVILADFNGDHCLDLYISDAASSGMILINDSKGNFNNSGQKFGSHVNSVKTADFNNDGNPDLFICSGDGKGVTGNGSPATVWLGDGHGHFTDSMIRLQSDNSNSIAVDVADINKDGRSDAVVVKVKLDAKKGYVAVPCPVEIWLNNKFSCNYLNEPKPGKVPVLFGPGKISVNGENTHALSFSPDGSTIIFSRYPEKKSYIMSCKDGLWSDPAEAFFRGKEACFSPYGDKVFYYKEPGDIYYNEKTENGWGGPMYIDSTINTPDMEYYPSVTYDGTLFFSRGVSWDNSKIMFSVIKNGAYSSPSDIGLPVNNGGALHAWVAPDKSYMIFNSPRKGSYTKLDLWISFHNADGSWTDPQNLGKEINSGGDAILCPTVTPDGKYMFFTRLTFSNGTGNVYWVSTDFIDSLKHK